LVARRPALLLEVVKGTALLVEDLVELVGDVLVSTAEIMLLAFLAPALSDALQQLLKALDVAAVAVRESLLHHAAQRVTDVAVVHEIVLDHRQDVVRVEVETGLSAVPA
jgi:RNA-binding protein YlmH